MANANVEPSHATAPGGKHANARTGSSGTGTPGHPAPARNNIGLLPLWFGLFGAPAAWAIQELVIYSLAAHSCYPRLYPLDSPTIGKGGLWGITVGVSLVILAVAIGAGLVALHTWRQTRTETGGHAYWALDTGEGRTRFMASSALMTSSVFTLLILVHTATIIAIPACWS